MHFNVKRSRRSSELQFQMVLIQGFFVFSRHFKLSHIYKFIVHLKVWEIVLLLNFPGGTSKLLSKIEEVTLAELLHYTKRSHYKLQYDASTGVPCNPKPKVTLQ